MRDKETALQLALIDNQNKLHANYNESDKIENDKLKTNFSRTEAVKTQGTIVPRRACWYEYGEKNT